MVRTEEWYWNERYNLEERQTNIYFETLNWVALRPCNVYKPKLTVDGNQWCALYGMNLQNGIAGFGSSPEKACEDFDRNWVKDIE